MHQTQKKNSENSILLDMNVKDKLLQKKKVSYVGGDPCKDISNINRDLPGAMADPVLNHSLSLYPHLNPASHPNIPNPNNQYPPQTTHTYLGNTQFHTNPLNPILTYPDPPTLTSYLNLPSASQPPSPFYHYTQTLDSNLNNQPYSQTNHHLSLQYQHSVHHRQPTSNPNHFLFTSHPFTTSNHYSHYPPISNPLGLSHTNSQFSQPNQPTFSPPPGTLVPLHPVISNNISSTLTHHPQNKMTTNPTNDYILHSL